MEAAGTRVSSIHGRGIARPKAGRALQETISTRRHPPGHQGELEPTHTAVLRRLRQESGLDLEPAPGHAEQIS